MLASYMIKKTTVTPAKTNQTPPDCLLASPRFLGFTIVTTGYLFGMSGKRLLLPFAAALPEVESEARRVLAARKIQRFRLGLAMESLVREVFSFFF